MCVPGFSGVCTERRIGLSWRHGSKRIIRVTVQLPFGSPVEKVQDVCDGSSARRRKWLMRRSERSVTAYSRRLKKIPIDYEST